MIGCIVMVQAYDCFYIVIIKSIYDAIDKMGFSKGNILEPAMGTGNFFGMLPEKMQESRLYGVELDGITGRIAKQLYPNADIKITGFEKTDYPNDFFDVAIGNVPFGQYKVADKQYDKQNFLIHDYCKCQYKNVGFLENKSVGFPTSLFSIFLVIFRHILHLIL